MRIAWRWSRSPSACRRLAGAAPRWTFCVAASKSGADVWISDVFAAERDRERTRKRVQGRDRALGAAGADAQCPQPREDKTEAVNAQFEAEAFNRRMGAKLHAVPRANSRRGGRVRYSEISRDRGLPVAGPCEPIDGARRDRLHRVRPQGRRCRFLPRGAPTDR